MIRDDAGDVITAGAGRLEHVRDVLQTEVTDSIQGIQAASDKGITRVNSGDGLLDPEAGPLRTLTYSLRWEDSIEPDIHPAVSSSLSNHAVF